jgi:hypothetical protein
MSNRSNPTRQAGNSTSSPGKQTPAQKPGSKQNPPVQGNYRDGQSETGGQNRLGNDRAREPSRKSDQED